MFKKALLIPLVLSILFFAMPGQAWADAAAEHAMWSQMELVKSNIADANDIAAQVAIDALIADFNDHPDLNNIVAYF